MRRPLGKRVAAAFLQLVRRVSGRGVREAQEAEARLKLQRAVRAAVAHMQLPEGACLRCGRAFQLGEESCPEDGTPASWARRSPEEALLALLDELATRMKPLASWVAAQPRGSTVEQHGRQMHRLVKDVDKEAPVRAVERLRAALRLVQELEVLHHVAREEGHA